MEPTRPVAVAPEEQPRSGPWERRLRWMALGLVVGLVVLAVLARRWLSLFRVLGYPGIFLLGFFSSASIAMPVPGLASVCAGGSILGLHPLLVGLAGGVGEALGELSGYFAGFGGRGLIEGRGWYQRVSVWVRHRGGLLLFLLSVVPNPLFDIVGIAAGGLRYPLPRFLLIVGVGKILKDTWVAYACALGLEWAIRFLEGVD